MVLHETTGALVSGVSSWRSPQTQYLALNLVMIPVGDLLQWNTHIPGRILEDASEVETSTHVSLLSSGVISLWALFFHSSMSGSKRT